MKLFKQIFTLACVFSASATAFADNVLSVESPLVFDSNDVVNVPVNLTNTDEIAGFQFDIALPDFLEIADEPTLVPGRTNEDQEILFANSKVLVYSMGDAFSGNSGAVINLPIKVKDGASAGSKGSISFSNVMLSGLGVNGENAPLYTQSNFSVEASYNKKVEISLSVDPAEVLLEAGKSTALSFDINSNSDVYGFQMTFKLPEGLNITSADFQKTDNLTSKTKFNYTASTGILLAYDTQSKPCVKGNGAIFTVNVTAAENFALAASDITISNVIVSYNISEEFTCPDMTVSVTNQGTAFSSLTASLAAANQALSDALETIATDCPDVKDNFTGASIVTQLTEIGQAIETAYANGTLNNQESALATQIDAASTAIKQLVADAQAAEAKYQADAANQKAYDALTELLGVARTTLQQTLESIAEDCPDVKDDFTGAEIAAKIDALAAEIDNLYKEGKCVEAQEAETAKIMAIAEELEKLKADAVAAEEQYKSDQAKNANEAAYGRMKDLIDAARNTVKDALAAIADDCPDVKDNYNGEALNAEIDALAADVEKYYENGTCVANEENVNAAIQNIAAEIEQMLSDALTAEEQFKSEQREASNKAAYDRLMDLYNKANAALEETVATIAETCPNVKDEYDGSELKDELAKILDEINALNEQGLCGDNEASVKEMFDAFDKQLADYLEDAKASENMSAIERENKAAYNKVVAEIDALQKGLDAMKDYVAKEYPSANVSSYIYVAQDAIDKALKGAEEALEAANAAGTKFDYTYDGEEILKLIEEIEQAAKTLGIESVIIEGVDNSMPCDVYTLNGSLISRGITVGDLSDQLSSGCYIVITDGMTYKVVIR